MLNSHKTLDQVLYSEERSDFLIYTLNKHYQGLFDFTVGFGEQETPYIIYDALEMPSQFFYAIRQFARAAYEVMMDMTRVASSFDEETLVDCLAIPGDYYPQIFGMQHIPPADMRFDIAVKAEDFDKMQFSLSSFKMLEVNAATPSFFWETFEGTRIVCEHFGVKNPNEGFLEAHTQDLKTYLDLHGKHPGRKLYFSFPYYGDNHEDILSFDSRCGAYQAMFGEGSAEFQYADNIIFNSTGAYINDQQVFNLFLHYPSEWAVEDEGVTRNERYCVSDATPWQLMTDLVLGNQLSKFPPITSDVLQNKALMAFAFTGACDGSFDDITASRIREIIPPTYFYYEDAVRNLDYFWEKPVYGREGAGVKMFDNEGNELVSSYSDDFDADEWYSNMPAIFQQHQPLPRLSYVGGEMQLLFTVYVSAMGTPTGVACRTAPVDGVTDGFGEKWLPLTVA